MPGQQRRATAQGRGPTGPTSGAGRKDEVGHTGIYPATGPFPEGDPEVLTPAEINRGPDYRSEDHGISEDLKESERLPRRGNEEDKPDTELLGD